MDVLQQVGVLQPSPDMGETCLVEWPDGHQAVYATGKRGRYQLVHLEVSPTSGAPVVAADTWGSLWKERKEEEGQGSAVLWCSLPVP